MTDSTISIARLFPDLLGTYGDGGNGLILQKRLQWRGLPAELIDVPSGEPIPESCDLYLLGGGEDAPQIEAARCLGHDGPLHRAVERGAVVLAVCAGMQILGHSFPDAEGKSVDGLGLLDCETVKSDEPRAVGELLVDPLDDGVAAGLPVLTGFENHGGRTRPGPTAIPLGVVRAGVGNGDGTEGVTNQLGAGKVIGTYLHGPLLARNPALADRLLSWVIGDPAAFHPIDDREAELLRADRLRAIAHGRTDGVVHRTWKDRLLRRN
ncbi:MAG: hypothetical protein N2037_03010 [Acidimicrobiales bacterium]|nr:hypothetical protein [Acidimicrobiales bacterium]